MAALLAKDPDRQLGALVPAARSHHFDQFPDAPSVIRRILEPLKHKRASALIPRPGAVSAFAPSELAPNRKNAAP